MKDAKTVIDGFTVEFEAGNEEFGPSCFISKKGVHGEYTGSLELLMGEGGLENVRGEWHKVDQQTIDAIEAWALEQGY